MSKSIFNSNSYGAYYYYTQHIELNNECLKLKHSTAQDIILTAEVKSLRDIEFEFYKTFTHEVTHFLDATSTLWGIEYSIRLFNYYENNNADYLNAFSLNDSEVLAQHKNLQHNVRGNQFEFKLMRTVLSYDENHGVYLLFKYYDATMNGINEVHSVPVSMLAVLEGHAYACEQLLTIARHESNNDLLSLQFLINDLQQTLRIKNFTEYSCILAYIDYIFPKFTLKQKLKITVFTCEFVLNMPTGSFPFPEIYIDRLFITSKIELINSLKMELARNMNRSSLLCLVLTVLSISFEHEPLLEANPFESQIENRIFRIFQTAEGDLDAFRALFFNMRNLEYDLGCTRLREINNDLVRLAAEENKQKSWHLYDVKNLNLPEIFLITGEVIKPKNCIDYDMEQHFCKYRKKADALESIINQTNGRKPHLRPDVYHDWLERIKHGGTGFIFYPDE